MSDSIYYHFFKKSHHLLLAYSETDGRVEINDQLRAFLGENTSRFDKLQAGVKGELDLTDDCLSELGLTLVNDFQEGDVYLLEFADNDMEEAHWPLFIEAQSALHRVTLELSKLEIVDDIIKQAVQAGVDQLGIDRIGILLYDADTDEIVGTWGINEYGELNSEHGQRSHTSDSSWVKSVLDSQDYVAVWEDVELRQWGKVIGIGWNAIAAMWDSGECIGWIACDNMLSLKPLESWRKMIIGQYAKYIGSMIALARQKQGLEAVNLNLERLVQAKSSELESKIKQLETTQRELVEAEKLASLGGLVAGVAHEVNTPVGIGVTAASHLSDITQSIVGHYQDKSMRKTELENYFTQAKESADILLNNLTRAAELIGSFKKLAATQTNDIKDDVDMAELVNNLVLSFRHEIKNRPITIMTDCNTTPRFKSYAGRIIQILSNLIKNSLVHGFDSGQEGEIRITSQLKGCELLIDYSDTGCGVDSDKIQNIFDPFYTTKRHTGGTGLGLNIVYNLVSQMSGTIKVKNEEEGGLHFSIRLTVEAL